MTLDRRLQLKRSVEDGHLVAYDMSERKKRSLDDMTETPDYLLDRTELVGSGVYGEVRLLKSEQGETVGVAKIVGCNSNLLGDPLTDPFRSEHVEPRILSFLWNRIIPQTPHIVAPVGIHKIVPWTTELQKSRDADLTTSSVYFMEHATDEALRYYLAKLTHAEYNLHVRVILFQICYTLAVIHKHWPGFKHNDLHDTNVCMHKTERGGYYKYVFNGKEFYVPRIGSIPIITDFDFACIPGYMMDNYKALEQEWTTPTFGINSKPCQGSDLWTLVAYIRQSKPRGMQKWIQKELDYLFGKPHNHALNDFRPMPTASMPSATKVLMESTLFDDFCLAQKKDVHETFVAKEPDDDSQQQQQQQQHHDWNPSLHHSLTVQKPYIRHCPLIYHKSHKAGDSLLPTQRFFICSIPADNAVDAEPPNIYVPTEGQRLIGLMDEIYDEFPEFGFDEEKRSDFLDRVLFVAQEFLTDYLVPIRWWPAAFTCAWMEVATEMDLFRPKQQSWGVEDWTRWWRTYGNVRYTDMQLLHFFMQWSWV